MDTDLEPWQQYFEAFRERTQRIPGDAFDRGALLYEAAHDVYQHTTNRLTAAGWDEGRALMVGRMFGAVVKDWVSHGNNDVQRLQDELRTCYEEWNSRSAASAELHPRVDGDQTIRSN